MSEAIGVPMTAMICRWCAAPFSVPTVLYERVSTTLRCPNGHSYDDRTSLLDRMAEAARSRDNWIEQHAEIEKRNRALRGVVTRLRRKLMSPEKST